MPDPVISMSVKPLNKVITLSYWIYNSRNSPDSSSQGPDAPPSLSSSLSCCPPSERLGQVLKRDKPFHKGGSNLQGPF